MVFLRSALVAVAALVGVSTAASIPVSRIDSSSSTLSTRSNSQAADDSCTHSATSRHCWDNKPNLHKRQDNSWPPNGINREYWLTVENTTLAPDGVATSVLTFNGTIPGPTLEGNWGDTFIIHVTNNLQVNGTSIHWHGIRQYNSNSMDGVAGLTQCPQAPGETITYTWIADAPGTSWYHSHFSVQYAAGLFGGIVINGPSSMDYDEDLGLAMINDWFHAPPSVFGELLLVNIGKGAPANGGLINGQSTCDSSFTNCENEGSRYTVNVDQGTTYRLRLVSAAAQTYFRFTIDNHPFYVIANDLVSVTPYQTDSIVIGEGQRYDIVFTANQTVGNYWMRAIFMECKFQMVAKDNTLGILSYNGAGSSDPTSTNPLTSNSTAVQCPSADFLDVLAPSSSVTIPAADVIVPINIGFTFSEGIFLVNNASFLVDWENPIAMGLIQGKNLSGYYVDSNYTDYRQQNELPGWNLPEIYKGLVQTTRNIFALPEKNQWVYFYINNYSGLGSIDTHPLHMHGHDFYVLSQGPGYCTPTMTNCTLNTNNPPRRDTSNLPGSPSHLVLAIQTDNPGIWNMHCHIAWHASVGFAWQFLERESEILATYDQDEVQQTCKSWYDFLDTNNGKVWGQDDSGI